VAAVEFASAGQALEPIPQIGLLEQVLRHTGSIVSALAMVAVTVLLIWFGVRPALKAILEARPAPVTSREIRADAPAQAAPAAFAQGGPAPNLIADLTSKLGRTPQKRLEQMIDFDEEQAATILKQWVRGARNA
jgi:flagellar M-ring protein FliF